MKIVFMGTPEFALAALKKLAAEHEVLAVYTKEPKVSGRGNKLVKTPVHLWAEEQGIEVRTPKTLRNAEEQAKFAALDADMAVVAAYGLILPPPVLEAFPFVGFFCENPIELIFLCRSRCIIIYELSEFRIVWNW